MVQSGLGKFITFFICSTAFLLFSLSANAQQDKTIVAETLYRVVMYDGNTFVGEIVVMDEEKVILKTDAVGQITLHRKYIKKVERIDSLKASNNQGGDIYIQPGTYLLPVPMAWRRESFTTKISLSSIINLMLA